MFEGKGDVRSWDLGGENGLHGGDPEKKTDNDPRPLEEGEFCGEKMTTSAGKKQKNSRRLFYSCRKKVSGGENGRPPPDSKRKKHSVRNPTLPP